MDAVIRHAEVSDLKAVGEFFRDPEVTRQTSQIPYRSQDYWDSLFSMDDKNHIQLVAESSGQILGHLGLRIQDNPRRKHCASFGITIHPNAQGKGIGKQLMAAMVELADSWLNLVRIELDVYTDNSRAIALYQGFGFEIEGESKCDSFRDGQWANSYRMSRIRTALVDSLSNASSTQKTKPEMKIRTFKLEDTETVISLWQQCGLTTAQNNPEKDIERKIANDDGLFLVGEIDNKVIGSVMGGYEGHRGWVNYLAINPQWQKYGFGKALMEHLENKLSRLGCPKINLQVRSTNQQVLRFYRSLGYKTDHVISLGKRLNN
ncbi:GNAT family acetyltransferase [Endozoicomonas atrinae]|uniref:GNAT family acetyltransferase n=1 Tax=Endozoicomonas atrinae TaxID=1333660 RepID=UPI0009F3D18A|nr:GNAT family acetyltransferase [Endozoicomonas atrinae]